MAYGKRGWNVVSVMEAAWLRRKARVQGLMQQALPRQDESARGPQCAACPLRGGQRDA